MYYYNSAYTTYNYAAGALGILVVAVVLTALLLVLVLPKQKDGHLPAFFQLLYDLFTPKALMIEKLLQVLYVFLNCLTVLFGIAIFFNGFFAGFGRIVLGLVILVVGPVLLRVIHELLLLAVMQVKATREINREAGPAHRRCPCRQQGCPGDGNPDAARPARRADNHCTHCGTWYREGGGTLPRVRHPAAEAGGQPINLERQQKVNAAAAQPRSFCCFEGETRAPWGHGGQDWIKNGRSRTGR